MKYAGWLLDAGTEHERAVAGAGYAPSMGGMTAEPMVLRSDAVVEIDRLRAALMRMDRMHGMMMAKVNHGASFYDAECLQEMNAAPLQAARALRPN